jgi:hypothetical protein
LLYVTAKRISKNWLKYQPIYRLFSEDHFDFSDEAALDAYLWETRGQGNHKLGVCENKTNGYVVGKHWMDVTIRMWREDIKSGVLKKEELYQDPEFKEYHWWLDKMLAGCVSGSSYLLPSR